MIKIFLPGLFLMILAVNLTTKTTFEINKNAQNHLALGKELLAHNQLDEAEKEFILAGVDTSPIQNLRTQPEKIKEQIIFWEKVVAQFPNYRDAHLKLAILNYKINRLFDAKKYLDKALDIDPNNETAKKLSSLL